jgi:hypothetical protein
VSEGGKALFEREPGSIPLAREASGNRGIPNAPAAAADTVLGGGGHRGLRLRPRPSTAHHTASYKSFKTFKTFKVFKVFIFVQKIYTS